MNFATDWLRVSEIAEITRLGRRYWQRRFARGDVPGARQIILGRRRLFVAQRVEFEPWWAEQLQAILHEDKRPPLPAHAAFTSAQDSRDRSAATLKKRGKRTRQKDDPQQKTFKF